MRRPALLLPFCLAATALAGCGNKGPLYLPARPAMPAATSTMPAGAASTRQPATSSTSVMPATTSSTTTPVGND